MVTVIGSAQIIDTLLPQPNEFLFVPLHFSNLGTKLPATGCFGIVRNKLG